MQGRNWMSQRLMAVAFALLVSILGTTNLKAATLAEIQSQIQTIINGSSSQVQWSVLIENQWGTQSYFSLNPTTPRRPASNTKLFTTAGAIGRLGPTYVWRGYQLQNASTASPVERVLSNSDNALADELYPLAGSGSNIISWCSARGIDMTGALMYDGSGLNYNNRFTARQTLHLLRYMMNTYTYGQWATHMAIGGTKGTLSSRLADTNTTVGPYTKGRVHAKTGTLTNGGTLSLSGYVDNYFDGQRYFFSIYCNSVPSEFQGGTLTRIDNIVRVMAKPGIPNPGSSTPITVDNTSAGFAASANWWTASSTTGYWGTNYHVRSTEAISDQASWTANIPTAGTYKVSVRYTSGTNRSATAPYTVLHTGGSTTVNVNQQAGGGTWVSLGNYSMASGSAVRVRLSCWTTAGFVVIADAVRLEKQ